MRAVTATVRTMEWWILHELPSRAIFANANERPSEGKRFTCSR